MKTSLGEGLKVAKFYYEHINEMNGSLSNEFNMIYNYLDYGLHYCKDYKTYKKEYGTVESYRDRGNYFRRECSYERWKEILQIKDRMSTETQLNYATIKEMLSQTKAQKESLSEILEEINHWALYTNPFNSPTFRNVTMDEEKNEDATTTYLYKMYMCGYYDVEKGIDLGKPTASLKVTKDEENDIITKIEVIRHIALSPRSPRKSIRIIVEDIDKDETIVGKDVFSKENYFEPKHQKNGKWINETVEIISKEKEKTKKK